MTDIKIIYDSRNYSIIRYKDEVLCYSYQKLICGYNVKIKECKLIKDNVTTDTNRKHLKNFVKYLDKIK